MRTSKNGVDKRRDGAALHEDDEAAQQQQHQDDRQQPELFATLQKTPQLTEKIHQKGSLNDAGVNSLSRRIHSLSPRRPRSRSGSCLNTLTSMAIGTIMMKNTAPSKRRVLIQPSTWATGILTRCSGIHARGLFVVTTASAPTRGTG